MFTTMRTTPTKLAPTETWALSTITMALNGVDDRRGFARAATDRQPPTASASAADAQLIKLSLFWFSCFRRTCAYRGHQDRDGPPAPFLTMRDPVIENMTREREGMRVGGVNDVALGDRFRLRSVHDP